MGDDSSMIKIGTPAGYRSGNGDSWDEKGHAEIVQILISHGDEINSIQFQYAENGSLKLSKRHGNSNIIGYKFDAVKLEHPKEYITWISGYENEEYPPSSQLSSITFGTNLAEYGPFGRHKSHDKHFIFKLGNDRQFGGFYGTVRYGSVKSIGVYLNLNTTLRARPVLIGGTLGKKKIGAPQE